MIIKSVKINNIRSYLNQEINFPLGSTLLAGDIGTGKSSILLAIEFAFFGVKRTLLPASSLLRHGKKEASVELKFELEGKEIIIKRSLKKAKNDIKQDAGYIIINNIKKEATAVELKSIILDLLDYPKELLTKSKDLLYRYTVYTPQEEMKQILNEDKDIRLDTLRKVFNIDKYKKIRENTDTVTKRLRDFVRSHEILISDLVKKQKSQSEKEIEIKRINENIKVNIHNLKNIKGDLILKKEDLKKNEEDIKALNKLKKDLEISEVNLNNNINQRKRNNDEAAIIENQIKILEKDIEPFTSLKHEDIKPSIIKNEKEALKHEDIIKNINNKISEYKIEINNSKKIKENILNLQKCPTCEQEVSTGYKKIISEREDKTSSKFRNELTLINEKEKEAKETLIHLKKELDNLKKLDKQFEITNIKKESINEKKEKLSRVGFLQERLKIEIGNINKNKIYLNKQIELLSDSEETYKKSRLEFEKLLDAEKKLEIEIASSEKEGENLINLISELKKEIKEKIRIKDKILHLKELNNWLNKYFISLMGVIERHIMLQIHRQFSELFENWFNIIMEDETISARLDNEFSPIIEQNGYETNIDHLSGGEKTSVALSYRLALNKVINGLITGIKTKGIIMLDEPTDGFSSGQLDKIREVLDRLNMKQIIIVSHESKIESFVDNIIRVNKEEHSSSTI